MTIQYVTREDIEGMGIPLDALVSVEQRDRIAGHVERILSEADATERRAATMGAAGAEFLRVVRQAERDAAEFRGVAWDSLHPEADARLAAATGGALLDTPRRLTFTTDGATPIDNVDKRPLLAHAPARIDSISVMRGNRTDVHRIESVEVRAGDRLSAECDAAGKWTARVEPFDGVMLGQLALPRARVISSDAKGFEIQAIGDGVEVVRFWNKSANGKPIEMIWHGVPTMVLIQSVTDQGRGEFKVSVRRWVDAVPSMTWNGVPAPDAPVDTARAAAPAKPAALAAGQVWAADDGRTLTIACRVDDFPEYWETVEDGPKGFKVWEFAALRWWRYLGTREEVAAARLDFTGASPTLTNRDESIKAIRDATIARMRGTDAQRAREALNHLRHALCAALATDNVTTDLDFATATVTVTAPGCGAAAIARAIEGARRWAPDGCEVVAAPSASPYREAPPLSPKAQAIIDECNGIASRMADAWWSPSPGTPAGLRRIIARALDVSPEDVTIHESSPGVVDVEVRGMGARRVEEAIEAMRDHLPLGAAALRVWRPVPPLAALRATIDAMIAADSGPFAHARAAALRSLAEPDGDEVAEVRLVRLTLTVINSYERRRGGQRTPRRERDNHPGAVRIERALDIYERERARSDAYARTVR